MKPRGGKRAGAGRSYSPWARMRLAERFAELKCEFVKAGMPRPEYQALLTLHAEEHPNDEVDLKSTKRLVVRGRCESLLFAENDPWLEQKLAPGRRRLRRWLRRHYQQR